MKNKYIGQMHLLLFLLVGTLAILAPYAFSATGAAANYRNVTVATTLNITNSLPEILTVTIFPTDITLNAGTTTEVICNATVRDFDGVADIVIVNATFFDPNNSTYASPDDNNNHYSNTSCTLISNDSITANYSCRMDVQYYANNATNWNCTIQAMDTFNISDFEFTTTTILPIFALNLTPGTLDFGNLQVGDISNSSEANITNFGNTDINVTVRGYGAAEGDNLSMVCEFNNIPVDQERFSLNASQDWDDMTNLTSSDQFIVNLTLPQRANDSAGGEVINSTYWKIRVPSSSNPAGECNGTLVFQAELA